MSVLIKTLRQVLAAIRQQNSINRELILEIRFFNRSVIPRLNQIETLQEAKKMRKVSLQQSYDEVGEAIDSGKL